VNRVKILIINLTRLGDIIQSIGLIRGLKKKYVTCEIDFLAMSSFSDILHNIPEISEIICLNDKLLVDEIQNDVWSAFIELYDKIDCLNNKNYDIIINPVISIQSSWLSSLIQAKEKRGMIVNSEGEQSVRSNWSAFLLANQHNLGDHSFNLVNIFSGVGECNFSIEDYSLKPDAESNLYMEDLLTTDFINKRSKKIGLHVGASQSNKSWSLESFKKLVIRLCQNPEYDVILFGGYKETEIKDYFNDIKFRNFHNWIGKFKLKQLISAISHTDLFISNDTGPMHIAACTKVPVINLSLGPVSMWETGPYSMDAIVLQANIECHPCSFSYECPHWNCHQKIHPDSVYELTYSVLEGLPLPALNPDIRYWKSAIDSFNCIHWVPLTKRKITQKELLFEIKRAIWGICLFFDLDFSESIMKQYMHFIETYYDTDRYDYSEVFARCSVLTENCAQIINGLVIISEIPQNNKNNLDKIKTIWSNVKEQKELMNSHAQQYSVIYDWFLYLTFTESQIEVDELKTLTLKTILLYKKFSQQLILFQQSVLKYHIH